MQNVVTLNAGRAAGRGKNGRQHANQRGFARAVRAEQPKYLAGTGNKRDALYGPHRRFGFRVDECLGNLSTSIMRGGSYRRRVLQQTRLRLARWRVRAESPLMRKRAEAVSAPAAVFR